MTRSFLALVAVALCGAFLVTATPARASEHTVQTSLYFGLTADDGATITEEQWRAFVFEEVTPRFPEGLTVIDAYGQSDPPASTEEMAGKRTKLLILVHPDTVAAAKSVAEVKAAFMIRFERDSVFHTEAPVRIVE